MIYTIQNRLGEMPWAKLQPGDVVRIPYRPEPYRERIVCTGTNGGNPVIVRGLLGPNGEKPFISGENATTDQQFAIAYQPIENCGLITLWHTIANPAAKPSGWVFENLKVGSATSDGASKTFTGPDGSSRAWDVAASGFYLIDFSNVTIRNCEVFDCGNGIFSGDSQPNSDLLIENCNIYGNGKIGSTQQHNSYCQAARVTYRNTTWGAVRPGSFAIGLKDRSADVLIEGNTIAGGARLIDLGTFQEDVSARRATPNATRTIIRNNVLKSFPGPWNQVVYIEGRELGLPSPRPDDVQFLNNTIIIHRDQSDIYYVQIFRNEYDSTANVLAAGNLFDVAPLNTVTPTDVRVFDAHGNLTLKPNWASRPLLDFANFPALRTLAGWDTWKVGGDSAGFGASAVVPPPPPPSADWPQKFVHEANGFRFTQLIEKL